MKLIFFSGFAGALMLFTGCATGGSTAVRPAGSLPSGYRLLYQQDFESPAVREEFVMTDPAAWRVAGVPGGKALELFKQSRYTPPFRSPFNFALISGKGFGDFVLEVDLAQTSREYGHRDMCIVFGFQNPAQFYYTHIATKADANAHNVFIVNNAPRTNLSARTTAGVDWTATNDWHKVRVERLLEDGTIKVYFDDMSQPIMQATNRAFRAGHIGFGSFDDTGKIDNIRIWGRSAESRPVKEFQKQAR